VSVGEFTQIIDSRVKNSIIQKNSRLVNAVLQDSMLGNFVNFEARPSDVSLGDFNSIT
jgi:glucose-1-phosphate thymidylyltransferase